MAQIHSIHNPFTQEEIETCLHALAAWAGNAAQTSRYLKSEKGLEISPTTLNNWKRTHGVRFDEIREKHQETIEKRLGHELREGAALALAAERLAVEKAHEALEDGSEKDPARAAANLARVVQSNVDKAMTVDGRPSRITETRGADEIIRSLVRYGVIQLPAETGTVEESDGTAGA